MHINTLSNRQDLHLIHEKTEGFIGKELNIFFLTNKENAYRVMEKDLFRNETREFGDGLYFVETIEESETFDITDRAVVYCRVLVGESLILTKPNKNITEKFLKNKKCDSVRGYLNSHQKYYIVYNYKKVLKVLALKAETRIVRSYEVSEKCVNYLCKFRGTTHNEECQLFCEQKNCRFYNAYHKPPCKLKCGNKNCELFETFHELDCKIRCTWENCIMFGTYHENKCIHLDHEKKDPFAEGVKYNKVNFRETVEMKKKKNSKNLKKSQIEGHKYKNISFQDTKRNSSNVNKFSSHFNEFPNFEENEKNIPKGYYDLKGKNSLKKVKDEFFDLKKSSQHQMELFNKSKSTYFNNQRIQHDKSEYLYKLQEVAQKRNTSTNSFNNPQSTVKSIPYSRPFYDENKIQEHKDIKPVSELNKNQFVKYESNQDSHIPHPTLNQNNLQNLPESKIVPKPQSDQNNIKEKKGHNYFNSAILVGLALFGVYKMFSKKK